MAYTGSIELISGIKAKNNGNFYLVDAPKVRVDDNTSLSDFINNIDEFLQVATVEETIEFLNNAVSGGE